MCEWKKKNKKNRGNENQRYVPYFYHVSLCDCLCVFATKKLRFLYFL